MYQDRSVVLSTTIGGRTSALDRHYATTSSHRSSHRPRCIWKAIRKSLTLHISYVLYNMYQQASILINLFIENRPEDKKKQLKAAAFYNVVSMLLDRIEAGCVDDWTVDKLEKYCERMK